MQPNCCGLDNISVILHILQLHMLRSVTPAFFWKATEISIHWIYHEFPHTVQLEMRYTATSAGCPPLRQYIFNKLSAQILG